MLPNSAKVVAELDATLRELQLAQQKTASEGHDNTALSGGDDGDSAPQTGARLAEMKSDVNKQQALSQQKVDGPAKSPVTGTAASVGTAEDAKSDNKSTKSKADDPGTENSDLSTKTAACLALGDELLKLAGEMPDFIKEKIDAKQGDKKDGKAVGAETAKKDAEETGKKDDAEVKKCAAAVDALLPATADLQKCAGVPDLPTDDAGLQKVASADVSDYIQKCAEAYTDDVQKGAAFAANFHAGLAELEKHAGDDEVAALVKVAEEDAENVAQLMGGMQGAQGGQGAQQFADSDAGAAQGDGADGEGGEGDDDKAGGDGDGDEGAQPAEGGDGDGDEAGATGGSSDAGGAGGHPAAAGGVNAEAILAALQQAGIDPAMLAKTASTRGLSERAVLKTLTALKPKTK